MPRRSLSTAVLVLILLSGRAFAEEVVVYSPHGGDIRDEFVAAFEAAHPGITVSWLDMGAASVLERLRAERGNPAAHVWWGAPSTSFMVAGREGLLAPYRPSWADAVPTYARGEGDLWFGQFDLPIGIGYVPDRIPDEDLPRSWDALVEPGRPGRLVIRDPPASGTMRTFIAAMVLRRPTVDEGFAWLARLHAGTAAYSGDPNLLFEKMARGEGDLTVWNVTDLLFQRAAKGYPFAVILPEEGVPVITDSIALVKGAGESAARFYEFVTSVEANLSLAEKHYRFPTRRDLPKDRLPAWTRELGEIRALDLDRARIAAEGEGWMARWESEVRSAGTGGMSMFIILGAVVAAVAVVLFVGARRRSAHEDV